MTTYTVKWFSGHATGASTSAEVVVPLVMDLVRPGDVVDVGCGMGGWLAEFLEAGVEDVLGLDGDYVDRSMLAIPAEKFRAHDLTCPLPVERKFDLAVSLEVAEHLPAGVAEQFVNGLTQLAPAVLFSAALPGKAGNRHVNEQWPSYWAGLFKARGYILMDPIRPAVWNEPRVDWWYRQNMFLYATPQRVACDQRLMRLADAARTCLVDVVHPQLFTEVSRMASQPAMILLRRQVGRAVRAIKSIVPGT
jgi:SAM-dependent methyltransferase